MVASFRTTRGNVPYELLGEYKLHHTQEGQTEIKELVLISWDLIDDFFKAVLPDVRIGPTLPGVTIDIGDIVAPWNVPADTPRDGFPGTPVGRLQLIRSLPQKHRAKPNLWCVDAEVVEGVGAPDAQDGQLVFVQNDAHQTTGFARVLVTYRTLTYQVEVADSIANAATSSELCRYVTRNSQFAGKNLPIQGQQFKWWPFGVVDGSPLNETLSKTFASIQYSFTWHMVPAIPTAAYIMQSKVNSTLFDNIDGQRGARSPRGTHLYLSPELSKPYYTYAGTEVRDITYQFIFQNRQTRGPNNEVVNRGHNFVYVSGSTTVNGATVGADFFRLFRSRGLPQEAAPYLDYPTTVGTSPYDYAELHNLFRLDSTAI